MTKAIIVTGAGGVGKTTVSAGLGVAAARRGARTLVMTVDPARRLADALGLTEVGGEPTVNPDLPTLAAAMLDAESSWDDLARRHADPQVADRQTPAQWESDGAQDMRMPHARRGGRSAW